MTVLYVVMTVLYVSMTVLYVKPLAAGAPDAPPGCCIRPLRRTNGGAGGAGVCARGVGRAPARRAGPSLSSLLLSSLKLSDTTVYEP